MKLEQPVLGWTETYSWGVLDATQCTTFYFGFMSLHPIDS